MARIVKATCPQCGAGLHLEADTEVVTCTYCGLSSFVERPNRPKTQAQAQPGFGTIRVDEAPRGVGTATAVVVFASVVLVAVGALAAGGFTVMSRVASGSDGGGFALGTGEKVTFGELIGHTSAADPKHADVTDLLRQARAGIVKRHPTAKLTSVYFRDVKGGTIDLGAGRGEIHHHGTFGFDYAERDPAKPPGQDVKAGTIMVALYYDEIHAVDTPIPSVVVDLRAALPDPKCASRDAWQGAVKSGVPADAVAMLTLSEHASFTPKSPLVWRFSVDGHPEFDRDIDADTCAVAKR